MKISANDFKKIMTLFDAGDFESRRVAINMLYNAYSRHYLIVIKRDFMHNNFDNDTAEEVLQDAFLRLLEKQTKPSSEFAIGAWLKTFILNVARDKLKKVYRYKEFSYHTDSKSDDDAISAAVDTNNKNDTLMIEACIKQVVMEYGREDPEGMELLTKVKVEGESYAAMSKIYGKSITNLKRIVSELNSTLKDNIHSCLDRSS